MSKKKILLGAFMLIALVGCKIDSGKTLVVSIPEQFTCPSTVVNIESKSADPSKGQPALTDSQFVYFSYLSTLNREPDMDGFDAQCKHLANGVGRPELIESLIKSAEFKQLLNPTLVQSKTIAPSTQNLKNN